MKTNFLKSLLAIACLLCSIAVYAHDFKVDGIYYRLLSEENQVAVTYYGDDVYDVPEEYKYTGSVTIPETVTYQGATYSVTSIGNHAFYGCSGLTEVTIPNSVTSIGERAFIWCEGLTEVTIGNSVTSIGEGAFRGCAGLTEVTIGNSVTSIGEYAFYGCSGLTEVTIGNSVTSIGDYAFLGCINLIKATIGKSVTEIGSHAFDNCDGLTSMVVEEGNTVYDSRDNCNAIIETASNTLITGCKNTVIPNSVTSIGDLAFYGCTGLTEITIPNSVTSIGYSAFYQCTGLTEITIPESVTSIGEAAFKFCDGLTSIVIPNSITSIGSEAFAYCTGLTELTIPNSVTSIDDYAFSRCTGLISVTIPNSVTKIDNSAFQVCTGLTEVTIGNSVTSIGTYAFGGCTGLTTVNFNAENCTKMGSSSNPVFNESTNLSTINIGENVKTIPSYAFSGCTGLKEVTIPNSVTSIDDHAFYNCVALRTVTIGSGVTEIGDYAFDKCDRIKEVYAHPTVPPVIGSHTFTVYVNDNATLYLYKESQEAYAKADNWEYFVKIGTIKKEYTLTYMVDDTLYAQEYYFEGDTITPIAEPEKENYTFSGWNEIPEIMPSHDVTVTGSFMEVVFDSVINDTVSSFIVNKEMYCDELIYIRDFDNTDWQAWYVPFEVDYTTIAYDFEVACINNVHQYDQNNDGEMDLTELEAVKMQEGVLKANYPYIVKAHSTGVKQVILNNVSLQPTEVCSIDCSSVSLRYTFTGTYNAMTGSELMQNGCYALQYNMLEAPTEESALGAFRWYIQIEQRSGDNNAVPQCIVLKVKEDFTDIENVMNNTDNAPVEYYDLSGRRVVEPTSGIYIVKQGNTVRKVVINK